MKSSTIEFFARPVEQPFSFAQHLYIVSSDSQGHQKILRAGPETNKGTGMLTDDLKVIYTDYIKENQDLFKGDWDSEGNHVKVYTVTGTNLEIQSKMEKMWEIGLNVGD